jgi:hypothetical protein
MTARVVLNALAKQTVLSISRAKIASEMGIHPKTIVAVLANRSEFNRKAAGVELQKGPLMFFLTLLS